MQNASFPLLSVIVFLPLAGAILIAAHLYRRALDRQAAVVLVSRRL